MLRPRKGITIAGKPLVAHMKALAHYEAVQTVHRIAAETRPVTERDVLDLRWIITRRSNPTMEAWARTAILIEHFYGLPITRVISP